MKFTTLVSSALIALASAQNYYQSSTTRKCDVITTTKSPYECPNSPRDCTVLACLTQIPVTLGCGCSTISTTSICPTACPTGCGGTQYITAIQDCFPTSTPPYVSSTTTRYTNTTTTTTPPYVPSTTITVTVCPTSTVCTGQTVTITKTLGCQSTCACVLPGTPTPKPQPPPPPPSVNVTTSKGPSPPKPTVSQIGSNDAAGTWGSAGLGAGVLGGFLIAVFGVL